MRSTKKISNVALFGIAAAVALTGCSSTPEPDAGQPIASNESQALSEQSPITVTVDGSRAEHFSNLEQLAAKSNAIVQVEPTGRQKTVPLPEGYGTNDSAPTPFVELTVTEVIEGDVQGKEIWVVSPGLEDGTERQALSAGGPFILFLAPAMYDANDPVGGYVVVGGPSGMFVEGNDTSTLFFKADPEAEQLPNKIDTQKTVFPKIVKTESELLAEGP